MLEVTLYQPEIPPNTGNIIRLCANSGARLNLIKPLAFELDDKKMRRAGLDYHEAAKINLFENFDSFVNARSSQRIFACSTKGESYYSDVTFQANDILLMGPETRGLPNDILTHDSITQVIKIPMHPSSRSLNLSNATAIVLYEAWRQLDFNLDKS